MKACVHPLGITYELRLVLSRYLGVNLATNLEFNLRTKIDQIGLKSIKLEFLTE